MVRSQQQSQDKLIAFLRALAYERQKDVLLLPSVGYIRDRTGLDFYTVDACLDYLSLIGKIAVARTSDGLWIDLQTSNHVLERENEGTWQLRQSQ